MLATTSFQLQCLRCEEPLAPYGLQRDEGLPPIQKKGSPSANSGRRSLGKLRLATGLCHYLDVQAVQLAIWMEKLSQHEEFKFSCLL